MALQSAEYPSLLGSSSIEDAEIGTGLKGEHYKNLIAMHKRWANLSHNKKILWIIIVGRKRKALNFT